MLIQCDASQLEWRTLLELAKDQVGIDEILGGEDTHYKNQEAFGLPSRLIAKIFLFRTIYRGSGWSFANDPDFMHVSAKADFWDDMNEKFYAKYKGIDACHTRWKDCVMGGSAIVGPMGRSWSCPPKRDYRGELKVPWTTLTNYPVQGTGADVMMLARIMAYKRIKDAGIPCDFISTVHDSIVVDCHRNDLERLRDIFDGVFSDLPSRIRSVFGYEWVVPMACESKYGPNMKSMEKFA
jgi:DNA polymerase I